MAQHEGAAVLQQHVQGHLAAPAQQGRLRQPTGAMLVDVGHPLDGGEQQFVAVGGDARQLRSQGAARVLRKRVRFEC
jgi:hypothetical protein